MGSFVRRNDRAGLLFTIACRARRYLTLEMRPRVLMPCVTLAAMWICRAFSERMPMGWVALQGEGRAVMAGAAERTARVK